MNKDHRFHPKYLIITADLCSDMGNQFVQFTLLDLLIFGGENVFSNLLIMCLLEQAPSIFLSPFAGLWVDRVGGRKWLVMVNLGKCVLVGLLAFKSCLRVIFPAYFCFIIGSLFFYIGRLSLTPLVVPKEELISFNSLNERVSLGGRIFGPWLIGRTIAKTGQTKALGLAWILFFISICAVLFIPKYRQTIKPSADCRTKTQVLPNLFSKYGRLFQNNHELKKYFFMLGFVLLGGGILNFGLPIFFSARFDGDIAVWGFIMTAFQAGSFLATILLPRTLATVGSRAMHSLVFPILGVAMSLLPYVTSHIQIALLMILFGCGFTLLHIFLESLIQQNSPKRHMGKCMSLLSSYKGLCYLGTILCGAIVSKIWDAESLLLIGSFLMGSAFFLAKR